jgi:hypothetical protein
MNTEQTIVAQSDRERLDIIQANITHLVDYYDDNNMMDTIPDYVWKCILEIEKQSNSEYPDWVQRMY